MVTTTKQLRVSGGHRLLPVSGTCRWVARFGTLAAPNLALIVITGKEYCLVDTGTGYALIRKDERTGRANDYGLPYDLGGCTCPDATFAPGRPGGCRHRRALTALGLKK